MEKKSHFIKYVIACFFPVVSNVMQIFVMAMIFEAVQQGTVEYFRLTVAFSIFFVISMALIFIASRMMRIAFMRDVLLSLRIRAFDKILNTSYKHFNKKSRDVYLSNLMNDINTFENSFFVTLLNFIFRCGYYVAVITILFFVNWRVALIIAGVSVLVLLISILFQKRTIRLQKEVSTENEKFTVNVANTFNGLEILKLNNMERKFLERSKTQVNALEGKKLQFNVFTALQNYTNVAIGSAVMFGLMIYLMFNPTGAIGYGLLVLTIQLSSSAVFPLVQLMPLINILKSSKAIYEKITKPEAGEIEVNGRPNPFHFDKEIALNGIKFAYDAQPVFKYLDFKIEKGKKYLVKGPSGVGKTTLIKLLSMAYDDYEGTITVDGIDLKTIQAKSFNENVAFIYQDVFLFEATIRENIALFKDLDPAWVAETARKAGLDEFIAGQEDAIDTKISENGKNLSGGERQRISIARALCKHAEILFVDEATSSLNEELGREIESAILDLDATVIAISHKYYPGITERYDFVVELNDGYASQYPAGEYFVGA